MAGRQFSAKEGVPQYKFSYRIRIENLSDQDAIQLLGRHWRIQELDDATGTTEVGDSTVVAAPTSGAGKLP